MGASSAAPLTLPAPAPRARRARGTSAAPLGAAAPPPSPGVLPPTHFQTISRSYRIVTRGRLVFATTPGSTTAISGALISRRSLLAIATKLAGRHSLTHLGTKR